MFRTMIANNYILFSTISILKIKTPLFYISVIHEVCELIMGFEKNIYECNKLGYRNM